MNGEPNLSTRRIVENERKPRPMNSAEPQLESQVNQVAPTTLKEIDSRKWPRRKDGRAQGKDPSLRAVLAIIASSTPIRNTGFSNEGRSNHQNDCTSHKGREQSLEHARTDERHANFEERADQRCSENFAVCVWTGYSGNCSVCRSDT